MRFACIVLALAACESNDDDDDTDDGPGDTDTIDDTDTDGGDTDTDPGDTDTDAPGEDFCEFTQCGGDVTGVWSFVGLCFDIPNPWDACPTATEELDNEITGTWTFDAAGTYTITGTYTYSNTATIPAECNGDKVDCSEWEVGGAGLIGGLECTGDVAVACTCTTILPLIPIVDSGTWMPMGENIRLISDYQPVGKGGGLPIVYQVCVDGDSLQLNQDFFFQVGYTLERTLD